MEIKKYRREQKRCNTNEWMNEWMMHLYSALLCFVHPKCFTIMGSNNIDCVLKRSYDAISSFPFSLECYKLIVHRFSRKERRPGFSYCNSVNAAMTGRSCVFLAMHFMDNSFVNLGEKVILTLLWQSGASESATVCFVISLSILYWLFRCRVHCVGGFKIRPKKNLYKIIVYCTILLKSLGSVRFI